MAIALKAREAGRVAAETPHAQSARLWSSVLEEVPLFAALSKRQVRRIAGLGVVARFDPAAAIVSAGDPGEAFYVIPQRASRRTAGSRPAG